MEYPVLDSLQTETRAGYPTLKEVDMRRLGGWVR